MSGGTALQTALGAARAVIGANGVVVGVCSVLAVRTRAHKELSGADG